MANRFFTQVLGKLHLNRNYLPESFSIHQLRLMDPHGNYYGLYFTQYILLSQFLKQKNIDIDSLTTKQLWSVLASLNEQQKTHKISLQLYFCSSYLSQFLLDNKLTSFETHDALISVGGKVLEKNGVQNCVVMHQDGSIYIHPKVRGDLATNISGVSHASLAPMDGSAIAFAGSFIHSEEHGWILENTSGHYGPRITQLRSFVKKLHEQGLDIKPLTVRFWIPNTKSGEKSYTTMEENAWTFLERTSKNIMALDEMLPNPAILKI